MTPNTAAELFNAWLSSHLPHIAAAWGVGMAGSLAWRIARRRVRPPSADGYGSAAWATRRDLRKTGCFNDEGMVLGVAFGRYLRSPMEQHVVIFGPPGSGKSRGQVIPTILASPHSLLILDLSGDLVTQTYRARSAMGPTYIWDPTSATSGHLNPWDMIRWRTIHMVEDVQRLSSHVVRPISQHSTSGAEHYERIADDLLSVASMHVGLTLGRCNGSLLLDYFSTIGRTALSMLRELETSPHLHVRRGAARVLKQGQRRIEEQWSAATEWLTRWEDPKLAWNTHDTTIPWQDLQRSIHPMTLILRLSPDDASGRLNRNLRMKLDLMTHQLTERDSGDYRHRLDVILDDVSELGDVPLVPRIAVFKRKYGWALMTVFQSVDQAMSQTTRYKALLSASSCWVIHPQNEPDTAEYLSRKIGDTTILEPADHVTLSWGRRSRTKGFTTHRRRLMPYDELLSMDPGRIVMCIGKHRIQGQGINVYDNPHFRPFLGAIA